MSTQTQPATAVRSRPSPHAPGIVDYLLAAATLAILLGVIVALGRGLDSGGRLPLLVWWHVVPVIVALALTPVMLLRARGDRRHRQMGYVWLAAMIVVALTSYGIRSLQNGAFSWIHILSTVTLFGCWRIWATARRHDWRRHRLTIRLVSGGALLIAGAFTLNANRTLGGWLWG